MSEYTDTKKMTNKELIEDFTMSSIYGYLENGTELGFEVQYYYDVLYNELLIRLEGN